MGRAGMLSISVRPNAESKRWRLPSRKWALVAGQQFPIVDNRSAQSRQVDRRVEVIISYRSSAVGSRN